MDDLRDSSSYKMFTACRTSHVKFDSVLKAFDESKGSITQDIKQLSIDALAFNEKCVVLSKAVLTTTSPNFISQSFISARDAYLSRAREEQVLYTALLTNNPIGFSRHLTVTFTAQVIEKGRFSSLGTETRASDVGHAPMFLIIFGIFVVGITFRGWLKRDKTVLADGLLSGTWRYLLGAGKDVFKDVLKAKVGFEQGIKSEPVQEPAQKPAQDKDKKNV